VRTRKFNGTEDVLDITEADALVYFEHWEKLHAEGAITANYAAKQLRFMRQMIDGCYSILRVPKGQQSNPFADLKIEKFRYDTVSG
jgi:hypothetical protein